MVIFVLVSVVHLNTVQVKSTVQLHGFSLDDCRKSHFNSIPDSVLCSSLAGKTLTLKLMDQSVCVPCCLVRPKCDRTQSLSHCALSHIAVRASWHEAHYVCCSHSHLDGVWFEQLL